MGKFVVYNVKGDGNCYYRCVWQLVKSSLNVATALCTNDNEIETNGIQELRDFVVMNIIHDNQTKDYLYNLIELYKSAPDILNMFPILKDICLKDTFERQCKHVINLIKTTNCMASSFEHTIIQQSLNRIGIEIIVLSQRDDLDVDDLSDKWLKELYVLIPKVNCPKIAILINEDNIHYKYTRFSKQIIFDKRVILEYLQSAMDAPTDSD